MQTMLIALPEITNNGVDYKITVKPKISVVDADNEGKEDIIKINPALDKPQPKLPQTGVLNWPITVLTIVGLTLFGISWIVFYYKKKVR